MRRPLGQLIALLLQFAAVVLAGCRGSEPAVVPKLPAEAVVTPEPRSLPQPTGRLQVCGILDPDKPDYTFNSAKIEEFEVDPRGLVSHLPGPFTMALLDGKGRVLSRENFGPMWGHAARLGPDGEVDCQPVSVPFSCINLSFVPGGESIEVRHGDTVLEKFTRTRHTPEVRITSPAAHTPLPDKGTLKIAWAASDADGDTLWHSIYYRPDVGDDGLGEWEVVIGDFQDTTMDLDGSLFPPGPSPELMVLTTDRFNTARAVVPLEGTSRHAPR